MRIYSGGKSIQVLGKQGIRGMAGPDGNPIGTVIDYLGEKPPEDYLVCNGTQYEISEFPDLADFFQTQFGDKHKFGGNGDSFAVPNFSSEENVLKCIKATKEKPYEDIYSEEETVIGKWIDGKPLYRITISTNTPSSTGKWVLIHPKIDNASIKSITGIIKNSDNEYGVPVYVPGSNTQNIAIIYRDEDYISGGVLGFYMYIGTSTVAYANSKMEFTALYTKSTDDPIT